jgi:uncharacterized protein (DUF427 family)
MCPWKGVASYYDVEVDGQAEQVTRHGTTRRPSEAAKAIEGRIAFWHGVEVSH